MLNLDYTYEQLIRFTKCSSMSENGFLQTAVGKYCRDELSRSKDTPEQCVVSFDGSTRDEKLPDVDIYQQPLEFLSVMLCLLEELEFQVSPCELYKLFIENYLSQGKFEELRMFVSALEQYYIGERSL